MSTQQNSFIANVNLLAKYINDVVEFNSKFDEEQVDKLLALIEYDLEYLSDDLSKGTFGGFRQIIVDLLSNYKEYEPTMSEEEMEALFKDVNKVVKYDRIIINTSEESNVEIMFKQHDNLEEVMSAEDLYYQLTQNPDISKYFDKTSVNVVPHNVTGSIAVLHDNTNYLSNIYNIELVSSNSFNAKNSSLVLSWADYTSALQFLVSRFSDITYIIANLETLEANVDTINGYLQDMTNLYNTFTEYYTTSKNMLDSSIDQATIQFNTILSDANEALTNTLIVESQVLEMKNDVADNLEASNDILTESENTLSNANTVLIQATDKVNSIKSISIGNVYTVSPTTPARVVYNNSSNSFDFYLPQGIQGNVGDEGDKGDKGDNLTIEAFGLLSERAVYDSSPTGFSYFATDTELLYFKNSAQSGDWTNGVAFGKGVGISTIEFESTTDSFGNPFQLNALDTYVINFTDGTSDRFKVQNGTDAITFSSLATTNISNNTLSTTTNYVKINNIGSINTIITTLPKNSLLLITSEYVNTIKHSNENTNGSIKALKGVDIVLSPDSTIAVIYRDDGLGNKWFEEIALGGSGSSGGLLVASPVVYAPTETAVGFPFDITILVKDLNVGVANISKFSIQIGTYDIVEVDNTETNTVIYSVSTPALNSENLTISVRAIDALGNYSNPTTVNVVYTGVAISAPNVLSPINGSKNNVFNPVIELAPMSVTSGFVDTAKYVQVVIYDEQNNIVYNTGEEFTATTVIKPEVVLKKDSTYYIQARWYGETYGWSIYNTVHSFSTINAYVATCNIVTPVANNNNVLPFGEIISTNIPSINNNNMLDVLTRSVLEIYSDIVLEDLVYTYDGEYTTVFNIPQANALTLTQEYYVRAKHYGKYTEPLNWSDVVNFRVVDAHVKAPVITGVSQNQIDVLPDITINVGAFESIPSNFDTPKSTNNFVYSLKTDEGDLIDVRVITLDPSGGSFNFVNKPETGSSVILECNWIGEELGEGVTTTIPYTIVNAFSYSPEVSGITDNSVDVHIKPNILVKAYKTVPSNYDVLLQENNFEYNLTTTDGELVESGYRTFTSNGGTFIYDSNTPSDTNLVLKVRWISSTLGFSDWTVINYKSINSYVLPPTIVYPSSESIDVVLSPTIHLSDFSSVGIVDTPKNTKVDISLDEQFNNIVFSYSGEYTTEVNVTPPLTSNTEYFIRALHEGVLWGESAYSTESFTTVDAILITPSITSNVFLLETASTLTTHFSSLSVEGSSAVPENTHFQVSTNNSFTGLITDTTENGAYRTNYGTSNVPLNTNTYSRVRHKDKNLGWTDWSTVSQVRSPTALKPTGFIYIKSSGYWSCPYSGNVLILLVGGGQSDGGNVGLYNIIQNVNVQQSTHYSVNIGSGGISVYGSVNRKDGSPSTFQLSSSITYSSDTGNRLQSGNGGQSDYNGGIGFSASDSLNSQGLSTGISASRISGGAGGIVADGGRGSNGVAGYSSEGNRPRGGYSGTKDLLSSYFNGMLLGGGGGAGTMGSGQGGGYGAGGGHGYYNSNMPSSTGISNNGTQGIIIIKYY